MFVFDCGVLCQDMTANSIHASKGVQKKVVQARSKYLDGWRRYVHFTDFSHKSYDNNTKGAFSEIYLFKTSEAPDSHLKLYSFARKKGITSECVWYACLYIMVIKGWDSW